MKRWWRMTALFCIVLSLSAQKSSAAHASFPSYPSFPRFPNVDDHSVIVGSSFKPVNDDLTDDEPAASIKMTHMRVRSEIAMRYARTAIICNVYNPSKKPQEATFDVLLPDTAFISGFTMALGTETYEAYVKERKEATQIYDDAVKQGASAAHVATKARDSNDFTIKFNVEGRSNATYRLRYEELLVRRNGVYNHAINLHPGTLVPKMDVVVHIKESQKISVLRVPELRSGNEIHATEKDAQNANAVIKRGKNEREATITFTPNLEEQKRLAELYAEKTRKTADLDSSNVGFDSAEEDNEVEGLLGQFVVQYDVNQPENGEILVNDGYFVHFFAPSSLPPLSKHVVFVLDTSGSMVGNKIEQLRKAMIAILSDLNPSDYFSIVEFNSGVKVHELKEAKKALTPYYTNPDAPVDIVPPALASPDNIASAKIIVNRLIAEGGTNIYKALDVAINIVQSGDLQKAQTNSANVSLISQYNNGTNQNKNELEPIIIFLTDGEPTVGETNLDRIITYLSERNSGPNRATLYSLAFGEDADRVFLRKLSLRNDGFMRHIYEAADAALQLHDFYREVSSPLLSDVKFLYPRRQIKEGSLSQSRFRTINDGSEVAVVGRVADNINEITPQVLGLRAERDGRSRKLYEVNPTVPVTQNKDEYLPLERLWAYLTIKQLLDKSDAGDTSQSGSEDDSSEERPEKKALAIALKYSFVTPLTSLVVVRLNKTDVVEAVDVETVDDPSFSLFSSSLPLKDLTYTSASTDEGLTVASSLGPVLFARATKRHNSGASFGGGYASGGHSASYGGYGGTHSLPSSGYGYGAIGHHSTSYGSHGSGFSSGSGYNSGNKYASGVPSKPYAVPIPTTNKTPSLNQQLEAEYHLQGYTWALEILNTTEGALIWDNSGSPVVLKLSKDLDPSQTDVGDYECWPGQPVGSPKAGVMCVYLTRCLAAREYNFLDYQYNYCHAGHG
ncbi:jg24471 [Pararge aegeria aegeria]|uniref:Jg24471 protein n=1 Tax=Pararge aegeria aegeria TaxID=348720 RepID=A0A8S4RGN0_9NEOP|nr:jg24471 [Pararge aegeria aegeria]